MAQIDNIVRISISRQTTQVDIEAFDIPLLMVEMDDNDTGFTDRVRTYTTLSGVANDLGINHVGYEMAEALLSGEQKPATFKIGKVNKQAGEEETYVEAILAVQAIDDTWYTVTPQSHLDSDIIEIAEFVQSQRKLQFTSTSSQLAYSQAQSVTYTATVEYNLTGAAEDDTISVIIAGERYQSTFNGTDWGTFTFTGTGSGTFTGTFTLNPTTGVLTVTNTTVAFTIVSARQDIAGGVIGEVPSTDISDTDPVGMDIGQRLAFRGFDRTIIMFSNTADAEYPELVWVGSQIVEVPGSNTWEYKQLPSVTVSLLSDTQITLLESRGYNYYIPIKGVNVTRRGKVAEGEWVD